LISGDDKARPPAEPGQGAPKCGAKKRSGPGTCTQVAGWGTSHPGIGNCRRHGGNTPNHVKAAEKEIARQAVATYGLPRMVDPATALLEEVWRTAGHVAWLQQRVQETDPEELTWGVTEKADMQATEFPGINTKSSAVPNVWLDLYRQERKHLVDVCKSALAAGVAERQVKLAERMGGQIAAVIGAIIRRLGLDPNDPAVLQVITAELSALAAG
jgi:hypothetical protein